MTAAGIRPATMADLDDVVSVLTDSFAEDPLASWVFPDESVRRHRLAAQWRFIAGEAYLPRRASTVIPGGDAAALWLDPPQPLDDEFWATRAGAFAEALEGDVARLFRVGEALSAHHPHDPHWYLLAIGVSPRRQGGRLGSTLLAQTLATAAADGTPAYLEATSPRSRALYERFGFQVVTELVVGDSPRLWPMWRPPA